MNNLNNSVDDVVECPLCMEPLEVDDLNFFPCTCGYQICRFCWHRIRTDENELCPACRKEYPENPADFKPLTQEEMIAFKSQKRQRDQQRKQNTESSKHLANVRVVQKNLVFVVGLPPRLADANILKKHEYFGKYGKIHKVVINPSTTYAGVQGPSASAYVTYVNNTDALRAIQSVNNIMIDGRLIKTSLGTTKYCSHFMKNQQCPKGDCMYLHELGDPEASFTKEEMHQGKHQEYEKRLHDVLIATSAASAAGGLVSAGSASSLSHNNKTIENNKLTGIVPSPSSTTNTPSSTCTTSNPSSSVDVTIQQKKAWPSLSLSPVNQKDTTSSGGVSSKCKKERTKQEKNKNEKNSKTKNKTISNNIVQSPKEIADATVKVPLSTLALALDCSLNNNDVSEQTTKFKVDKTKDRHQTSLSNRSNERKEVYTLALKENDTRESDKIMMPRPTRSPDLESINGPSFNMVDNDSSGSSNSSSSNSSSGCLMTASGNTSPINQSVSGKSSKSLQESLLLDECTQPPGKSELNDIGDNNMGNSSNSFQENLLLEKHSDSPTKSELNDISDHNIENTLLSDGCSKSFGYVDNVVISDKNTGQKHDQTYENNMDNIILNASDNNRLISSNIENNIFSETSLGENKNEEILANTVSNLNLFDENSYFSSPPGVLQKPMLVKNKHSEEAISNQLNSGTMPNLPDLIIGIDAYQNNTNDWEEAFKNVMLKTNEETEEKLQQQSLHKQLQHRHPHHHHNQITHQEDLHRIQEIQKRNSLLNSFSLSQLNGPQNKYETLSNSYLMGSDLNSQANFLQQQHQLLQQQSNQNPNENVLQNSLFGTNMSKFFDFHKNQQQKQQHCVQNGSNNINGYINENLHMVPLLDSNRLNSQLMEQSILSSEQQHQKQKVFGKMDQMLSHHQQQQPHSHSSVQSKQNQFIQNSNADDDLGFDPFIETQKALAELIENEEEQKNIHTATSSKLIPHKQANNQQHQQQIMNYMQRARMPPPGFNHVNNFGGYGAAPRLQHNSKIMPFMNLSGNYSGLNCQPNQQHQQQLQIPNNAWSTHFGNFQQQLNDQQVRQVKSNPLQNDVNQKGNDWTAMDPAILSFRQFSFPQQTKILPHLQPQQQQQDMFLQQLAQQQQPGYNSQSQHMGGNVSIPNAIINSQQSSEAHVNANVQGMLEYLKTRQFF